LKRHAPGSSLVLLAALIASAVSCGGGSKGSARQAGARDAPKDANVARV